MLNPNLFGIQITINGLYKQMLSIVIIVVQRESLNFK
jgi:hypothetical protein